MINAFGGMTAEDFLRSGSTDDSESFKYASLRMVLDDAFSQAAVGKGRERHANGEAFEDQIICEVTRRLGSGYPLGQAVKKIYESQRLGGERGVAELLGCINYVAAAIIVMRESNGERD